MNAMRISSYWITELVSNKIFVFGSNLDGAHCNGAAKLAYQEFGAVWGAGVGLRRQTYAIPTIQGGALTIKLYVYAFLMFASNL